MRPATLTTIPVSPHPQSLSDPAARLFVSDGHLLRGIRAECAPFYAQLLAAPALARLCAAGLIQAERAAETLDGYPLVVRHPRVDFVSVWREWPSLMLRDAALMVCDLGAELVEHGYGMLDIHPWNVLFDFGRPVFVDFTAVVPLERAWLDELAGRCRDYWVLPLTFVSKGYPDFARSIRKSCEVPEPLDELLKQPALRWFPFWYFRLRRKARTRPAQFFRRLRARLEGLPLPGADSEALCRAVADADARVQTFAETDARARALNALLARLRPRTLMDVGCGAGSYTLLAERQGIKVVAIDVDEARVNALYRHARAHALRVLPLLLDFSIPTVSQWRKKEVPAAPARLACDAVLLCSLLERLVFELGLSFERVADLLAAYGRRHAIVEYVPPRPEHAFGHDAARWYDLDNFVKAMAHHFRLTEVCELERGRKLLLFDKRSC
jgi:SAM-dependent methyltransferase